MVALKMRISRPMFYFLFLLGYTNIVLSCASSKCNGFLFTFQIQADINISDFFDILDYATHSVRTTLECSHLCSYDPGCQAFYLVKPSPETSTSVNSECTLISEPVDDKHITNGNGTYGFLKSFSSNNLQPPPNVKDGVLVKVEKGPYGISAVYDCSTAHYKATILSLLYNPESNSWPGMNTMCSDTLCKATGLSNTVLNIGQEEPAHSDYTADVICLEGETHHSDAICVKATGVWSFTSGDAQVGCVSTTCARYNGDQMIYAGTMTVTTSGHTCQRWDSQTPNTHLKIASDFNLDGYNLEAAKNYCRDPGRNDYVWCYVASGVMRYEECDIPLC